MTTKRVHLHEIVVGAFRMLPDYFDLNRRHMRRFSGMTSATHQSIGKVVEYWSAHAPERIALRFEDQAWTYAEFNSWTNRIAATFSARGVARGDTVAIMMDNRPELLACFVATLKLGAIAGMVNHNQRGDVLAHSLGLIKPKLVVISAECHDGLQTTRYTPDTNGDASFLWHGGDNRLSAPPGWIDLGIDSVKRSVENPVSTEQVTAGMSAYYVFTSGTTGMPKASVMTHFRWLSSSNGIGGQAMRIRRNDVFYCCLPLYHNNALSISLGATLSAGATFALDRKFSTSRFWDRLRHYDATAFCYVGELLRYLLNAPASANDAEHKVRLIVGNGLRPEIWEKFENRFGIRRIYEFYGASEGNIAFVNAFGVRQTAGFTPMSYSIVEFDEASEWPTRNAAGWMNRVKRGGVGLLLTEVNKKQPFEGYTDPVASEKKLFRDVFKEGDCWFNTGDLVRDQGLRHIQFVDRVGDTFRWKGENVATGEIEGALALDPSLEHGVVYGVSIPGCDGRAGMAAITLKPDATFDGRGMAERLLAALPSYAVPVFIRIKAQHEATGTFKYRKVELKQEGFDLSKVKEPIFMLMRRTSSYEPLTEEMHERLKAGIFQI